MFVWLKRYMPRSLYGRAAAILLLPFLALQIVLSLVFVQRHFEDVTRQMTRNLAVELAYALDAPAARGPLDIAVVPVEVLPVGTRRLWYDISGRTVESALAARFAVTAVDLTVNREVNVWLTWRGEAVRVTFPRRYVSARNPHQLLVIMVVASVFLAVVAFLFMRNQLRPITRMAAAAEAFGRGHLVPYHPSGATEVRAAGASFNDMRARIERQMEQRTLMLSGVSHDLRTPLTRLRLGLSMLPPDEETREMRRDLDDMERMLDAFLDFVRDGVGEEPAPVDVGEVMRAAIEMAGGVDEAVLPEAAPVLPLREMAMKRALANLIGNARRHGGRVRAGMVVRETAVTFSVEDDGPGIAPADREAAMRPFVRLDRARGQNRGGSVGLGLSIAADVARRHGGVLRLGESADLGGLRADIVLAR
ncbi:MAG: ATP-binding protein [Shimia sp.]